MLHDHRAFDRALNPDAAQALENALEPMAALLSEQAKPQPRNIEDFRAWRSQIADLEEQLALIAERGGVSVTALQKAAAREISRQRAAMPPDAPATPATEPPRVRKRRPDAQDARVSEAQKAATDLERLTGESMEISRQIVALLRQQAALAKHAAKARRVLFVGRGRG